MSKRPVRVAHVVSHPIQYFAPLYRELARRSEIDVTVYFCSAATVGDYYDPGFARTIHWDAPLLEGYRWRICASARDRPLTGRFLRWPSWDVVREIWAGEFDVVWVHGYSDPTMWLVAAAARLRGARLLIREEQTLLHGRPPWKLLLKRVTLSLLFRSAVGLFIGEQNRRYFKHYGMSDEQLFPARYCVDNEVLLHRARELAPRRPELRRRLGLESEPVVLFVGKLIEKKQPILLLEAFARIRKHRQCSLAIVGDGPLRKACEQFVFEQRIPGVAFLGFRKESELPEAYAAADLFVLPSGYETWGLVVNEAMNFSLPPVVTDHVGCASDLVRDGWNGFIVPHRDSRRLAEAIECLVASPALRRTFGARSQKLVAQYSVEACADGIVAACLTGDGREAQRREVPS